MKYFFAVAIFATLLSVTPVAAQSTSSKQFREYSDGVQYVEFNNAKCNGQVLNDGLICIMDVPEERRPETRLSVLRLFYKTAFTIRTVYVSEVAFSEADIAYVVNIRDYITLTESDVPRLQAIIKSDGSVSIDTSYGEYPPQFSAEEESRSLLQEHEGDIGKLISALVQSR